MKRAVVLASVGLLAAALPATAAAYTWQVYAHGQDGAGGKYATIGYGPRENNRVYHQEGTLWWLYYCNTDGSCDVNPVMGTVNPLVMNRGNGYARAVCWNKNDNSGVVWTCQTLDP